MRTAKPWHLRLDEPRPTAVRCECDICQKAFWLPPSKAGLWRTCGRACAAARLERMRAANQRVCETCGTPFRPRPHLVRAGGGRFCSQKCNAVGRDALNRPEVKARAVARRNEKLAAGEIVMPSGPDNHRWKGGADAYRKRRRESGAEAASLRAYRKANPDKVREFSQRRASRKLGRLPRGTLPALRVMQKDRCAICRASLKGGGHVDHILPLARGGKHEPRNLQLLCPPCNLAKSDRDPVAHMQSLGRLL